MRSRPLASLLVAACCAAIAGCATRPPELKPSGTASITLTDDKKTSSAAVELDNLVTVALPRPREPGYTWQITLHDVRFLKQTTEITPATTPEGGPTVSFIAVHPGRTRLRFLLVPTTAARIVAPVDQQEVVITIQ